MTPIKDNESLKEKSNTPLYKKEWAKMNQVRIKLNKECFENQVKAIYGESGYCKPQYNSKICSKAMFFVYFMWCVDVKGEKMIDVLLKHLNINKNEWYHIFNKEYNNYCKKQKCSCD